MKKLVVFVLVLMFRLTAFTQCAICTKTASQLGEGPAKDLNSAILYLMFMPLTIMIIIGYMWYKRDKASRLN